MTSPVSAAPGVTADEQTGYRFGVASLLMLPALLVSLLVAAVVGYGLMAAMDLEDGAMLYDQGAVGWVAAVALNLLIAVPQVLGMLFGMRARRLGAVRIGTVGLVINAIVIALFAVTAVGNMLLS